ncbi:TPA: excisionase [Serratia marcescens]|uniref:Excisionase n=2 Tax=Serratia TaxID=613 RepID=A0A9X8VD89_SERMA|nr:MULTISPECIES: excisionase [Serratia]MBS3895072.1 excisionase [Serratia marcescens]TXE22583.1 excisionase [Serratia ureilytica]HBC7418504.1 excisionase [Serratia marcescens]
MPLLTIPEFIARLPKPRSVEQVRRWIRAGKIQPPPILNGREYLIDPAAEKRDPSQIKHFGNTRPDNNSLTTRIKNGKEKKTRQPRPAA